MNLQTVKENFEVFKVKLCEYKPAINIWENNWRHVKQLFHYGSTVRKGMYITNSIAATNSSLRKVIKKGAFQGYETVYRAFYLKFKS
ncbi:MAG: transposase [Desulfovibrionaceae bacterium]|nr:transposase [Desulfovibrionaceae bacterium]